MLLRGNFGSLIDFAKKFHQNSCCFVAKIHLSVALFSWKNSKNKFCSVYGKFLQNFTWLENLHNNRHCWNFFLQKNCFVRTFPQNLVWLKNFQKNVHKNLLRCKFPPNFFWGGNSHNSLLGLKISKKILFFISIEINLGKKFHKKLRWFKNFHKKLFVEKISTTICFVGKFPQKNPFFPTKLGFVGKLSQKIALLENFHKICIVEKFPQKYALLDNLHKKFNVGKLPQK